MTQAHFTSETYVPSQLIAGNAHLLIGEPITLASGQNLTAGAVLGKITSNGHYTLSLAAATDGSEVPDLVLSQDTNASLASKPTLAYRRGDFLKSALTLGAGHTLPGITATLRLKGIQII